MRQSTLAQVLDKVKAHCGWAQTGSVSAARDTEVMTLIESMQVWLAAEHDWPFLRDTWKAVVSAGANTVAVPTTDLAGNSYTINFERPIYMTVYYNEVYEPVLYGIGPEEYNAWDPQLSEKQDPILKWAFYDNASGQKIEVWPMTQSVQNLYIWGTRNLLTLRNAGTLDSTKVLDLDDEVIALFVAAELLGRSKNQDATSKLEKARERLRALRADMPGREDKIHIMGQRRDVTAYKDLRPIVLVHG